MVYNAGEAMFKLLLDQYYVLMMKFDSICISHYLNWKSIIINKNVKGTNIAKGKKNWLKFKKCMFSKNTHWQLNWSEEMYLSC